MGDVPEPDYDLMDGISEKERDRLKRLTGDDPVTRTIRANLKNDPAALDEVGRLLAELRSAWAEIAQDPAVASSSKAAA